MPNTRVYKPSFSGGELSPEMFGRIDDAKFQNGAASIENLITTPLGPAEKRPGFEYVAATKNNGVARLIPFVYSTDQTMVIELGDHYARFHTEGETLQYSLSGVVPWDPPPSVDITYTLSAPTVITWNNHGLTTGDPIRFYVWGLRATDPLPIGLQLGYTYTVNVLDVNTFNIIDADGNMVAFSAASGGSYVYTNYPGSGSVSTSLYLGPSGNSSSTSSSLSGLASVAVSGGLANVNINVSVSYYAYQGGGAAVFQQSTDGVHWHNLAGFSASVSAQNVTVQIPITNLNTLRLRVYISGSCGYSGSVSISGTINSWSVDVPTSGSGPNSAELRAYRYYSAGDIVSYGGNAYVAVVSDSGGVTTPGLNPAVWYPLPSDLTYEISTPYAAADVFDIHYSQSEDIVTLVHPAYPPAELKRLGPTQWSLVNIAFGQKLSAPIGVAVSGSPGYEAKISSIAGGGLITTATNHTLSLGDPIYITPDPSGKGFYLVDKVPVDGTGALIPNELYVMDYSGNLITSPAFGTGATIQFGSKIFDITNYYVVTAVTSDGIQQSPVSAEVSVLNNLNVTGSFNTVTWSKVSGAFRYYVYKKRNGLYGYIGETTPDTLTFNDNNIAPDMSITPPINDPVFGGAGDYPSACGYYQQRRIFAGTDNNTQTVWMSKSGTESDFSYSLPVQDTDRVAATIAARQSARILHILPLNQLILLTTSTEMCCSPLNSDVITPSTISARAQSYIGASNVPPTIVNNTAVYCANRGGHVREMGYSWQLGGYITGDVSLRAAHLFDNFEIVDQAYSKAPWQIVWFVSSNGNLLGLTYIPEESVGAWHHHTTQGKVESIACVAEGAEDRLYAVINRTVNGSTVRYIERMSTRNFPTIADGFFVDSGATFDGTNTTATTVSAAQVTTPGPLLGTFTVTASAPIFAYPDTTDVGDVLVITGSDGNQYRLTILSETSTTTANALASPMPSAGVLSAPTTTWAWARQTISNITWLEGQSVAILADGAVLPQQVVSSGGVITLDYPAVKVTLGLPYTATIESLPLVLQVDGSGQGRTKNINKVWIRVNTSSGIYAGPSPDRLVQYKQRTTEPYGTAPYLVSDEVEIVVPASWQSSGQIYIQQSDPLPLTVVGLTLEAAIGG